MDSIDLDFGNRDFPTGGPGMRGWASHPHTEVTAGGITLERLVPPAQIYHPSTSTYEDYSLLGLLWNQGASPTPGNPGAVPPVLPGYVVEDPENHLIQAQLTRFTVGGTGLLADATLTDFELTLRVANTPGLFVTQPIRVTPTAGVDTAPGFHTGADICDDFTRPGITIWDDPTLEQADPADTYGDEVDLLMFQTGFMGVEWAGLLEGHWTGSNILPGAAQTDIVFTHTVTWP